MFSNLKNFKKFFKEKVKNPVFFIHPNPNFVIGLEKLISNFHIICSRKSDLTKQLSDNGVSVFCLDNDQINNSAKILRDKKTLEFIAQISKKAGDSQPLIITFKPSPVLEKICGKNNFKYLGNDWKLNRELEDKIKFDQILKKLKIPSAESEIVNTGEINYQQLKNKFGANFVVQFPRGFSGNSTFLITSALIKKPPPAPSLVKRGVNPLPVKGGLGGVIKRKIKVSKFIKGSAITLNACLIKSGLLTSQPFYQITGEKKLTSNPLGSCGNDFAIDLKLDKETTNKIYAYTKEIGEYLKTLNYKGIFGLDFVVDENNQEVHLIEINPRLVASMPVFTKLQIRNGELPFLALHILEFLGSNYAVGLKPLLQDVADVQYKNNFSQLILRNTFNSPVKISRSVPSGTYKLENNKLKFIKSDYCLESLNNQDEFLIQCLSSGNTVNSNIEYANIQMNDGVVGDNFKLRNKIKIILDLLFKEIKLEKLEDRKNIPLSRGARGGLLS